MICFPSVYFRSSVCGEKRPACGHSGGPAAAATTERELGTARPSLAPTPTEGPRRRHTGENSRGPAVACERTPERRRFRIRPGRTGQVTKQSCDRRRRRCSPVGDAAVARGPAVVRLTGAAYDTFADRARRQVRLAVRSTFHFTAAI